MILESIGQEGQKIRKYYQKRLPSDPSKDYYFIQRLTGNTQALLLEYGFIDNPKDLKKLQDNLINYGEAVVRAIAEYTNTPYTSPSGIDSNVYVVQRGDTLYSIANKFNITVNELKSANNLTSNLLNVGDKLIIPNKIVEINPNQFSTYTVQKGDSLYSIAKKFNTTVDDLINYNQLSTSNLSIGQKLLVPNTSDSDSNIKNYYVVKAGDSLYSIAKNFNTTIDEIIKANNLSSTILQIGDQLIIPGYTEINKPETLPPTNNEDIYIVKAGDSLYSIAKKFDTTVDELKRLNNLSSNLLTIGQQIKVPTLSNDNNVTYYVQSGDSLYSIARKYNTTVDEIKKLNNLTNELLSIGQALLIP